MFYIGCPMWGYKDWLGNFFPQRTPQGDFLRLYSRKLNTVEGNTIFYALPSKEAIKHWVGQTPEGFRFCPKVSRSVSHAPDITQRQSDTELFIERMRVFGDRLGPIFLQLPPGFGPAQNEQLRVFLERWPTDLRLAVEVRHPDFYREPHATNLNTLLSEHNVGRILMDIRPIHVGPKEEQQINQRRERKPDLPLQLHVTSDFTFVRYIGHPRMEVNEPFLQQWAPQLAQWHKEGRTLYVFCHCPFEEHSPNICYRFYQHMSSHMALPPLAWQPKEQATGPEQMQLF